MNLPDKLVSIFLAIVVAIMMVAETFQGSMVVLKIWFSYTIIKELYKGIVEIINSKNNN